MTYFGFLALFVGIPIAALLLLTWRDRRRGIDMPAPLRAYSPWWVLFAHIIVALLYTTPWDNYLVANQVWWYDPQKVTGVVIGWVPIEEYTFFIVQPLLSGLWFLYLARRLPIRPVERWENNRLRWLSVGLAGIVWLISLGLLLSGESRFVYFSLIMVWALLPIMLQFIFGADILWRYGRLVLFGLGIPTLYLAAADAVAIANGVWTIDPAQSLHWLLGGILPLEEFIFFLVTNVLIVFGMTLVLAVESQTRVTRIRDFLRARWQRPRHQLPSGEEVR